MYIFTFSSSRRTTQGFTLIELLVVISIIGLISSIALASLSAAREKARIAAGIQFAANMYHRFGADEIALYDMTSKTDGGAHVFDTSGNQVTLTCSGTPYSISALNPLGNAQMKSGAFGLNQDCNATSIKTGTSYTHLMMSSWVMPTSRDPNGDGTSNLILQGVSPTLLYAINPDGTFSCTIGSATVNSTKVLPLNVWSHAACYLNGQKFSTYIDGKSDTSIVSAATVNLSNIGVITITGNHGAAFVKDFALFPTE